MFRSAKALDRAKTHASFRQALAEYQKTAESWFDGSVGSVDRRISSVDRLLHHVRATVARLDFGASTAYLNVGRDLSGDRKTLTAFRHDMLTGASDYSTPVGGRTARGRHDTLDIDFGENAPDHTNPYTGQSGHLMDMERNDDTGYHWRHPEASIDRRWVKLEAAKFVSANTDALGDTEELSIRAANHAEVQTSTFTPARSKTVTAAFVDEVNSLRNRTYRPIQKRTAAVYQDFDPQAMFL